MFSLTPRERKVIVFLGILIFCGALLRLFNVKINEQSKNSSVISTAHPKAQGAEGPKALLININTASLTELEKIPGVGPEIANRIIAYRTNHGQFLCLDNLKEVKGIGNKKFEAMKDCIALQDN